ncbi:MAG: hypothetical protein WC841_03920 [Candidatus Shapirobacteria bacterium]|jgi:hypothetical protein
MSRKSRQVFGFILKLVTNKSRFFFWLVIRFISAILPLVTIYQFSGVIKLIEQHQNLAQISLAVFWIFIIRIADNYLRLLSITKLEYEIANISFDIHNVFLTGIHCETKEDRHAAVQAVRNFADASSVTLNLIKQPGIDSLVSVIFIPAILMVLDFQIFTATIAYILVYYFIDYYSTQRYANLKDILNGKTEAYYAKLQDSGDFDLEQKTWTRHFRRLTAFGFAEWSLLQNTAVFFYSGILLYLIGLTVSGSRQLSDLVLIMGYVSQTQVLLNSFSSIQDNMSDMRVGLERLAKNNSISAIDLDDLT